MSEVVPPKRLRPHELRQARKELGLTQAQLAGALGLDASSDDNARRTISDWEAGRNRISGPVSLAMMHLLAIARGEYRSRRVSRKAKA